MSEIRKIGICTGGGDCPGLNAVIRAAVKTAILKYRFDVVGIRDGFDGLIWPEKSRPLMLNDVSGILPRGGTILGTTNRGNPFAYRVSNDGVESVRDFSAEVIKNAKAINLPTENHVLHAVRQHFLVDGADGIVDPVGMLGARVEVDVHVVHGNFNRLQNPIRVVKGLQLEVEAIVFNGLAASLALLTNEQKEMGALVIDIGGGTTNFAVYADGIIKHTGVLAVGGDHVSNDLAYGLKVPLGRAEQLKIEHGSALMDDGVKGQTITIANELGLPLKTINLEHLRRVMSMRLEEILQLIEQDIARAELLDYLRAGVFICGGGARIPQITKLAERVFQMPSSLGKANSINGIKSALDQPEFATAIGLVKFGSFQQKKRSAGFFGDGIKKTWTEIFNRK